METAGIKGYLSVEDWAKWRDERPRSAEGWWGNPDHREGLQQIGTW